MYELYECHNYAIDGITAKTVAIYCKKLNGL